MAKAMTVGMVVVGTMAAWPLSATAEPVRQADLPSAPGADGHAEMVDPLEPPTGSGTGPGARNGRGDGSGAVAARDDTIDLGETGQLLRLVDEAARQRALAPAAPRTPPRTSASTESAGGRAAIPTVTTLDDAAVPPPSVRRGEVPAGGDSEAMRALVDHTTAEQRNLVREALGFVRSALQHPLGWIVLGSIGGVSLLVSATSRRGK